MDENAHHIPLRRCSLKCVCVFSYARQLTCAFDFVRSPAPNDLPGLQLHLERFPFWPLGLFGVKQSHHGADFQAPGEVNHFGFAWVAGSIGKNRRHGGFPSPFSSLFLSPPLGFSKRWANEGGGEGGQKTSQTKEGVQTLLLRQSWKQKRGKGGTGLWVYLFFQLPTNILRAFSNREATNFKSWEAVPPGKEPGCHHRPVFIMRTGGKRRTP